MGKKEDDYNRGINAGRDGGNFINEFLGESDHYYLGKNEGRDLLDKHGHSQEHKDSPDLVGGIISGVSGFFVDSSSAGKATERPNSRSEKSTSSGGSSGGHSSPHAGFSSPFETGVGVVLWVILMGVIAFAALAVIAILVSVFNPDPIEERLAAKCDFKEKLESLNNRIGRDGISATVCKGDRPIKFFLPSGSGPQVGYLGDPEESSAQYPLQTFINVEGTWGQPGGMPNLYRLYVVPGANGFDAAGVDSVRILIRAIQ